MFGDLTDEVSGGSNLTNSGAILTTGVKGVADTAYAFDGSNDFMIIPETGIVPSTNKTWDVLFWIKTSQVGVDPDLDEYYEWFSKRIFSCMIDGVFFTSLNLSINEDGYINIGVVRDTGETPGRSYDTYEECVINDDTWHLVYFRYNGRTKQHTLSVDDYDTVSFNFSSPELDVLDFPSPKVIMSGYNYNPSVADYTLCSSGSISQFRVYESAAGWLDLTYDAEKP